MPRQATEFTQFLLPEEALLAPEATWNTLRGPDSTAWLAALWAQAHAYANTAEPARPPDGLHAEQSVAGTHEAVLISLPTPQRPLDSWFALLVRTPAGQAPFRYFTLDLPPDFEPMVGEVVAVPGPTLLREHHADTGGNTAYGTGPPAPTATTVARLLVAVGRLLLEPAEPEIDPDADAEAEDWRALPAA